MSGLSLVFDTPQLAQDYEVRSAERQFRHGQRLIAELGVRAGERVLDIGSGTGLLAEHVAGTVGPTGRVLGIDPLPLRVEIAQRKGHLPESLRVQAVEDIKRELEAFRTPEGIRLEGKRLFAIAHKPASH
ncbi:methyltransferase domain-containing protein [Sorangium sp. So ce861]|uniref:methyltransferase domain-containing protein n=1 Tax=Sorangium sp. So ce861 TaxID=3133323 RepID=UPI003F64447A